MPGPLIRTPLPDVFGDQLPEPIRKLVDTIFPPDDVVGPAMPQTAIVSGVGRMAIPGLTEALGPLSRGSLDAGIDMAKGFLKDPLDWLPLPSMPSVARGKQMSEPAQVLYSGLKDFADNAPAANEADALKIFAGERHYRRPTPPGRLRPKKGLLDLPSTPYLRRTSPVTVSEAPFQRDPLVEELYNRYKTFQEAQQKITNAPKSFSEGVRRPGNEGVRANGADDIPNITRSGPAPSPDRKPLLGRWNHKTRNNVTTQAVNLKKTYKKPVK